MVRGRVAAPPRLPRGYSATTATHGASREDAHARESTNRAHTHTGTLKATELQLAVLASYDPDLDDAERHTDASAPGALTRTPSWLEAVEARRAARRSGDQTGFTIFQAFLATVKSAVGPAVLYMPKGFEEGGLAFSLGMLLLSYALFGLGASRLLESWDRERRSRARRADLDGIAAALASSWS